MNPLNPKVDEYLAEGCGRCPLGGTPECKVHKWQAELEQLRMILLSTDLKEEVKWSVPCYTYQNNNILILAAFMDYCSISFFKGVLLNDPADLLEKPGENSQAVRLMKFQNSEEINDLATEIQLFIAEAIEIEKAGLKVEFKAKTELVFPDELLQKFAEDPMLESAFYALTPGRRRGYVLYFSAPKQSKTREARIEKCVQQIMDGKGYFE